MLSNTFIYFTCVIYFKWY